MTLLALSLALVVSQSGSQIHVSPGRQEVLKVPGVTKVALGNQSIADVRVTGSGELLISGKERGTTSLLLWTKANGSPQSRTIIVDDGRADELTRMVHEMVNPTLRVVQTNDKIVIDGRFDSMNEYRRLKTLVGDDPNVKILATMNPAVFPFIASQINDAFTRNGIANARAVAIGSKIILEGSVTDEGERVKAQQIADSYYATFGD